MIAIHGYCRDCKHWRTPDEGEYGPLRTNCGECVISESENGKSKGITLAFAMDAEGYFAILKTAPNFGCVQFEAKA